MSADGNNSSKPSTGSSEETITHEDAEHLIEFNGIEGPSSSRGLNVWNDRWNSMESKAPLAAGV